MLKQVRVLILRVRKGTAGALPQLVTFERPLQWIQPGSGHPSPDCQPVKVFKSMYSSAFILMIMSFFILVYIANSQQCIIMNCYEQMLINIYASACHVGKGLIRQKCLEKQSSSSLGITSFRKSSGGTCATTV